MAAKVPKNEPKRMTPQPSGPYAVGCIDVMTSPGASGVLFRLFYPTDHVEGAERTKWLPDKNYLKGYARYYDVWPRMFAALYPVFMGEVHVPAFWNVPPMKEENNRFPVIVFSHGLAACRTTYSTICIELASNGYVVAAVEHRDFSASASFFFEEADENKNSQISLDGESTVNGEPSNSESKYELKKKYIYVKKVKPDAGEPAVRNKQVHIRSKECSMVLDCLQNLNDGEHVNNVLETSFPLNQFQNLLDFNRVGVSGHSFGGATAIITLAEDKRFKAGVSLDPWMIPLKEEPSIFSAVTQQMLFVNTAVFQTKEDWETIRKIDSSSPERLKVSTLKGTVHLNQTDVPMVCQPVVRWVLGSHSRLDRFVAMDLTTRSTMIFFSKHLDVPVNEDYATYLQMHHDAILEGIPPASA